MKRVSFFAVTLLATSLATIFCVPCVFAEDLPQCGQSDVTGAATKIYESPDLCAKGPERKALKDLAVKDAIKNCDDYCAFLSKECENAPKIAPQQPADYDCKKKQDDPKESVHARAVTSPTACACKKKAE